MGGAAVLYHYPCADGAFAALAAHLYHRALRIPVTFFPNTVYAPLKISDLQIRDFDVIYLLDFVGPEGFSLELGSKAQRVVILDHHKTALERAANERELQENMTQILDMSRSGAMISYDYFSEKLQTDKADSSSDLALVSPEDLARVELLFKYVQDADLWKWALPHSKAFSSGLKSVGIEFSTIANPNVFEQLLSLDPVDLIVNGEKSIEEEQKLIDKALANSFPIKLGNGRFGQCLAVRADEISGLRSELGNQLSMKSLKHGLRGIGAVVYEVKELNNVGILKISLRGVETEDTTQISEAFGGGGHRGASSFMIKKTDFEMWLI